MQINIVFEIVLQQIIIEKFEIFKSNIIRGIYNLLWNTMDLLKLGYLGGGLFEDGLNNRYFQGLG